MRLAFYVIIMAYISCFRCASVCAGLTSLLTTFERPPPHIWWLWCTWRISTYYRTYYMDNGISIDVIIQ